MVKVYCALIAVLLAGTAGCSNKEQIYEGMYQGLSSADETRMSRDPSYEPVRAQDNKKQSYQEYKREREQVLKE